MRYVKTFVAPGYIQCRYAPRFLRRSRGRGVKALDNQNLKFVAERLSLRRCFRVDCSLGKHLTLCPVPGLLLQGPGQCSPKSCAWLIFQHLWNVTRVTGAMVRSSPPSWPPREKQSVRLDPSSTSKLSPRCRPEHHSH